MAEAVAFSAVAARAAAFLAAAAAAEEAADGRVGRGGLIVAGGLRYGGGEGEARAERGRVGLTAVFMVDDAAGEVTAAAAFGAALAAGGVTVRARAAVGVAKVAAADLAIVVTETREANEDILVI